MDLQLLSKNKVHGGWHKRYSHTSGVNNCDMTFAVFIPEAVDDHNRAPVLYWLSGLTCTDENFMQKAGAFRAAAEHGIILVAPDTSPRGEGVADDPQGNYDFGLGAGFYVNATQAPYSSHYHMFDYVSKELPEIIDAHFPTNAKKAISGHSMGGHGALVVGLSHPHAYSSISAFAPITHPIDCPWGQKAFQGYLGGDQSTWLRYDSCEMLKSIPPSECPPILVSQGLADNFLTEQLKPHCLAQAAEHAGIDIVIEEHAGYDHSYFFISSFIDQHIAFAANAFMN
ncbi:S-formylglutathione hydrolase [Pseudoalteromonas sp. SSDWG2]|uniref:S-formylglutathione hydrolase n=1 Tax=Pseudoalteromonas sp. SSDWG2 TaxID=3139391 RepID=UPI003BA93E6B